MYVSAAGRSNPGGFWDDLNEDMQNRQFRHHFLLESERIAALDRVISQLDEVREALGVSKAQLARAIERQPETVRRLLTAESVNPQFSVVAEMAAALGYRVQLVPMSSEDQKRVAQPLRELVDA